MPIYEYHCKSCEADVEILIRSSSDQAVCPECGSTKLSRLLSVIAKGTTSSEASDACESSTGCGLPQCGMGGCGL